MQAEKQLELSKAAEETRIKQEEEDKRSEKEKAHERMKEARAQAEEEGKQVIDQVSIAVQDGLKRKFGAEEAAPGALKKRLGGSMFAQLNDEDSDDDDDDE